jgi:hypothetical protein
MYTISELVVGTITRNGLDSPEIESRWERDFSQASRPVLGPTEPPVQWVLFPFPGGKALALTAHPHQVPLLPQLAIVVCYRLNFPSSCLWILN